MFSSNLEMTVDWFPEVGGIIMIIIFLVIFQLIIKTTSQEVNTIYMNNSLQLD